MSRLTTVSVVAPWYEQHDASGTEVHYPVLSKLRKKCSGASRDDRLLVTFVPDSVHARVMGDRLDHPRPSKYWQLSMHRVWNYDQAKQIL